MAQKSQICRKKNQGYAKLLAWNYDTVQECYSTKFPDGIGDRLNELKERAIDQDGDQGVSFNFGGNIFQMRRKGTDGNKWAFSNDDLLFMVRTDKPGWNINVRYLSAGIWEHGVEKLKELVVDIITGEGIKPYNEDGKNDDWIRLSRIDVAYDFHSPEFSKEQKPGMIANQLLLTSGVKAGIWFNSRNNETITIGQRSTTLQIQIYDKGKEIIDKSGKEWMYDIWECAGYEPSIDENGKRRARDVWRFEIRFGKEFLKNKNVRTFEAFKENRTILVSEAIDRRRMILATLNGEYVGLDYKHRERLDLHPLWAELDAFMWTNGQDFIPNGRMITMRRHSYIDLLKKQQAGIGRSLSIAQYGAYDEEVAREDAAGSVDIALKDRDHDKKIEKCLEKQMFLDEAK